MANAPNKNVVVNCPDGIQFELLTRKATPPGFMHLIELTEIKKKQMAKAIEKAYLEKVSG